MGETQNVERPEVVRETENRWKIVGLTTGGILLTLGMLVIVASALRSDESVDVAPAQPPQGAVDDCNHLAAQTARDTGSIVKDGAIGGAIGAGVGAAGGAIADGGDGAGKGAGIGALAGAAAGTLYGINQENSRTEAARLAYRECMAKRGY
jgi:hypothetical protein